MPVFALGVTGAYPQSGWPRNPLTRGTARTSLMHANRDEGPDMTDDTPDPNDVPTKPLPGPIDAGAPTEPLSADLLPEAYPVGPVATVAPSRPTWIAPAIIVGLFALLLVLAVLIVPTLIADRISPLPTSTPTVTVPTPTLTEDAPQEQEPATEEPPVVVEPEPTEVVPEPTETPVEPEPTPTP